MKTLILGRGLRMSKIIHCLTEQEVEVICLPCENSNLEIQPARDKVNLVLVDTSCDNAERACRYATESLDVPVLLVVNPREVDWERIKSLRADGYILDTVGNGELIARLKAAVRRSNRLSPGGRA